MKKFPANDRIGALMTILVLGIGSVSIMAITHVARADQKGELCVFFACGNGSITGGTSGSGVGGSGTTGTLIVTKELICNGSPQCVGIAEPSDYTFEVTGNNPSLESFKGSATGTQVSLGPGKYQITETGPMVRPPSFSGNCNQDNSESLSASGNINAGETQNCKVTNFP